MKKVKQIRLDIMVDEEVDGENLAENVMKQLNGNIKVILNAEILKSSFQDDITDEYKLYYSELAKEGFRTVKFTAGMTQEFEIISTNAPDSVIKANMQYINIGQVLEKLKAEGTARVPFKWLYDIRQYDKAMDGCYMEIAKM